MHRAVGAADGHPNLVAGGIPHALDRQAVEVGLGVGFLLPAVVVEKLPEISLAVHQADAHQGQAQVGGGLQVVPGQDPEASGKQGQAFVQAEFHGKIGDGLPGGQREIDLDFRVVDPPFIMGLHPLDLGQVAGIFGELFQAHLGDPGQKRNGVATAFGPQARVDAPEQFDGLPCPAPPHVAGNSLKENKLFRNVRLYLVGLEI